MVIVTWRSRTSTVASALHTPGGDSHMEGAGMLVGNFELNP